MDEGRPTPSSFLRRQESRGVGKGLTLTPTPFPNDILEQQLTHFGEEVIAKVRG